MAEKLSDVPSCVVGIDLEPNETIRIVAQIPPEKVLVLSKESNGLQPVENRNDVIVFNPTITGVLSDLAEWNPPDTELFRLIVREILVEQIQAAASDACR